jgi:hypothetical protein
MKCRPTLEPRVALKPRVAPNHESEVGVLVKLFQLLAVVGSVFAVAAFATAPASAVAAAPPNDNRASARPLGSLPATVTGTTAEATREAREPSACRPHEESVWYRLETTSQRAVSLVLDAQGDLDAVVAVYRQQRSQLPTVACAATDRRGKAGLAFRAQKGATYFILVGQQSDSDPGSFQLEVFAPEAPARPPGALLPTGGVRSTVDPLRDADDAWSVVVPAGRTFRINLVPAGGKCLSLSVFRPGTSAFSESSPIRRLDCGGYTVFTPGPDGGGRYTLLVRTTAEVGGLQRYRLQAAKAGPDDTSPGLVLRHGQTSRGGLLAGALDVVDLHRFTVSRRSDVTLAMHAGSRARFDLTVLRDDGSRVSCECGQTGAVRFRLRMSPGRYFAAVRARDYTGGRYRLSLLVREITSTVIEISGSRTAKAGPGRSMLLQARITPRHSGGVVRMQINRFDPLEGWQFYRLIRVRVGAGGVAAVGWKPPSVGRWEVRATYRGTRRSSPSRSNVARLLVA